MMILKQCSQTYKIYYSQYIFKGNMNSYVAYVCRRVLNSRYTKFGWNRLRG
jgi:hypothetical protein